MARHPQRWHAQSAVAGALAFLFCYGPAPAWAQQNVAPSQAQTAPATPEEALLQALAANPATAPYTFQTRTTRGQISLAGRVGTKAVHDAAIQTAISLGVPVRDDLVIDTSQVFQQPTVAVPQQAPAALVQQAGPALAVPAVPSAALSTPYPYPAPLFGPAVDPFWGYEPPLIIYPPWWNALSAQRLSATINDSLAESNLTPLPAGDLPARQVEMTIDPNGYARLRGKVPSEEVRAGLVAKASGIQGVVGVIDRLEVDPRVGDARQAPAESALGPRRPAPGAQQPQADTPPGPPMPFQPAGVQPAGTPPVPPPPAPGLLPQASAEPAPSVRADVQRALAADPGLSRLAIRPVVDAHSVRLEGEVPSALEALQAFACVQRVPGVTAVSDGLTYPLPRDAGSNPLVGYGASGDLEPFLASHIVRHLGPELSLDRLTVRDGTVEATIRANSPAEQRRAEAVLRTIPLLRGFRIEVRTSA